VTGDDVPHDEMPNKLRPVRRDALPPSDAALAALLAGTEPPAEPAPEVRAAADILAALKADPTGAELAGEAGALAEFRRGTGVATLPRHSRHRRPRALPPRFSAKAAAAMGVAVLSIGGLATAAFAGVLPAPVQRLAHNALGAPSGTSRSAPIPTRGPTHGPPAKRHAPYSPQATNPVTGGAVHRLCAVYTRVRAYGSPAQQAVVYRNLVTAARGVAGVTAYCGKVMPFPERLPSHHGRRDRWFLHHRDGRGVPPREGSVPPGAGSLPPGAGRVPPGERRGHHGTHSNDKPGAHRTERRSRHHRRHVLGNGAPMTPHATGLPPLAVRPCGAAPPLGGVDGGGGAVGRVAGLLFPAHRKPRPDPGVPGQCPKSTAVVFAPLITTARVSPAAVW